MEALKQRALQFLQQAEFAKERGFHELALFDVEQCAQLYMKYLLYKKAGDFPKTHYLRDLAERLVAVYGGACGIAEFARRWSETMALLEYAYIASRYTPLRARAEDVDRAFAFINELIEIAQCLETST